MTEQVQIKGKATDVVICEDCGAHTFRKNKVLLATGKGKEGKYVETAKCRYCGASTADLPAVKINKRK